MMLKQSLIKVQAYDEAIWTWKILSGTTDKLQDEVARLVEKGKGKFRQAPIVLEIENKHFQANELAVLIEILAQNQVVVIGIRSPIQELIDFAKFAGLAIFDKPVVASKKEPSKIPAVAHHHQEQKLPKIVVGRITASEQVLSKDGDLVLLGEVEAGADAIAHGSITTYSAMRGSVFAGINGDKEATIFIHSFDAQLVSIAGVYKQFDTVPNKLQSHSVRVILKNGKLKFKTV